jgi:hypothetical protein
MIRFANKKGGLMKSQLAYKCILGSVACFSQVAGIAFETTQYENNIHSVDVNEQVSIIDGFTVLNLGPSANHGNSVSDLARKIALMNADVVCISEVYDANTFYEALQNSYAHFLYMDSNASALATSDQTLMGGFLIASKYPLEAAQFSKFTKDASNEGLIDFVIRNGHVSIGHIYAANLKNDEPIEIQTSAFIAIIKKMQKDFLNTDGTSPFFLCGDFSALQEHEESKILIDTYFVPDRNYATDAQALLLETSNLLPRDMSWSHTLSTTKTPMDGVRSGLRAVVRRKNHENNTLTDENRNENGIILCGGSGSADLSVQGDSQGNASAGGSVGYSYESESGNLYSGEVSGNVQRDSEGNYSGGARVDVGIQFNQ